MVRSLGNIFFSFVICVAAHVLCGESLVYKEFLKESKGAGYYCGGSSTHYSPHEKKKKFDALLKKTMPGYKNLSQSEIHLAKNFYDKLWLHENDPLIIDMCHRIIKQELEEQKKGRYTLLHGESWDLSLLQDMYTALWKKLHDMKFNKYIFARFRKVSLSEQGLKNHRLLRKQLLSGKYVSSGKHDENYKKAVEIGLAANFGLFCNPDGDNSFTYFRHNSVCISHGINLDYVFKQLSLEKYYKMFRQELLDLQSEHQNLSMYGHMLLFSFTPAALKQVAFPSYDFFLKDPYVPSLGSFWFDGYIPPKKPIDVQKLFDKLRKNPTVDAQSADPWVDYHFCIVLSDDYGGIPGNGVEIYDFNAVDKKRMQIFEKKKKALLDKIILNIDWDMAKEPTKAQKHMQAIIAKAHLWKKHGCLVTHNNLWSYYLKQKVGKLFK